MSAIRRIVSGGQTGVDRAALEVALDLGLPCGGWVPRGRRTEDGRVPDRFAMRETASAGYPQRTRYNVRDSDATLILSRGAPSGGTALTVACAESLRRPCMAVDLDRASDTKTRRTVRAWLQRHRVRVLNVAGPRESTQPGIAAEAFAFLRALLADESSQDPPPDLSSDPSPDESR